MISNERIKVVSALIDRAGKDGRWRLKSLLEDYLEAAFKAELEGKPAPPPSHELKGGVKMDLDEDLEAE